ncbi:putative sterol-4-alpha-carboxylate 3-dehydrogenase like protein [Erysiphe necator]|uniref:Putative sterol-4-alpha-carboxylate 3-dehydrogenase like protein n=1 Tax=Uncinula necator TaxID=52586 RepID=A0A0B1PAR3_UNCNE|nr:putative sterol-4-alpha-carboxylate 3-dehydrogenase like protein [Erysiphe necator]
MNGLHEKNKTNLGNVLVIGGCGFLGHHIVDTLHKSYNCNISVLDLRTTQNRRPESDGIQYFEGDITSVDSILPIFLQTKPSVVIHTASPTLTGGSKELYWKVNVDGTRCVIETCQKANVNALVYTSSASIISDNMTDLINADERWPIIPSKYQTEYYSETKVYENSKTGFQLGDNCNLFDFTYVGNVAQAHCLAAAALIMTSQLSTTPLSHEKVDGEAFFITNDQPIYFWDFARAVWKSAGSDKGTEHVWEISQSVGMIIGGILENLLMLMGKVPSLTRRQVRYSCMTRYYDCSKAKRLLGYTPEVHLWEGIERSVAWFKNQSKLSKPE